MLADRQNPEQPALFDDQQLPIEAAALESIRTQRYQHTGARLTDDDAKALRLVELLTLNWGVKRIAREMNVSPHSVRAARRLLAAQGKLAPYKQRVVEAMEDIIEAGVTSYRDALEDGRIQGAQIPVGLGIIFDKRALALGEPTTIAAGSGQSNQGLKVEDLNAYLSTLPSCKTPENPGEIDSASSDRPSKPAKTACQVAADAGSDAGSGQPTTVLPVGDLAEPDRDQAATSGQSSIRLPDAGRTSDASAAEGGGGGAGGDAGI